MKSSTLGIICADGDLTFVRSEAMPLGTLQHFTIEPSDLERTKDFYCDVLGLENGDRPPLDFPGY